MERKPYSNPARPRGSGSSARRSISARPFEGDRNARAYDRGAYRSVASTDYRRSEYAGGAYRREEPHRRDAYAGSDHRRPPEPPRPRRAQPRRPKGTHESQNDGDATRAWASPGLASDGGERSAGPDWIVPAE